MFFQYQGDIIEIDQMGGLPAKRLHLQLDSLPFHMQVMSDQTGFYTELRFWKDRFDRDLLEEYQKIWNELDSKYSLSYDAPNEAGYSVRDIFRAAKELDVRSFFEWKEEQVDAFLDELCDLNMLRRESMDTYAFSSDNFRYILGSDSEVLDRIIEVEGGEEQ